MICPECGQPQGEGPLHFENCSRHDESTCIACKNFEHGDVRSTGDSDG